MEVCVSVSPQVILPTGGPLRNGTLGESPQETDFSQKAKQVVNIIKGHPRLSLGD